MEPITKDLKNSDKTIREAEIEEKLAQDQNSHRDIAQISVPDISDADFHRISAGIDLFMDALSKQ